MSAVTVFQRAVLEFANLYNDWKIFRAGTKVCPSYASSCAIFNSLNFMVNYNNASADIAESQTADVILKMTIKLNELNILQLEP